MQTPDGQQFGPVPRQELDAWLGQGRITAQCQLLLEGSPQWQWASEVYPVLSSQTPSAATLGEMPSFGTKAKRASDSSGSGSFDFLSPQATTSNAQPTAGGTSSASDAFLATSGGPAVSDSIITGGSFIATSPTTTSRKSGSKPGTKPAAGKKNRQKSGLVTAVAVVNYVMGGLNIFGGIVIMLLGLAGGAMLAELMKEAAANDPDVPAGAIGGAFAMIVAITGMVAILIGTVTVVAGYGVAQRRQWGRILSFVLAGFNGLGFVLCILTLNPAGILSLAYCVFIFVALLQKDASAEFR